MRSEVVHVGEEYPSDRVAASQFIFRMSTNNVESLLIVTTILPLGMVFSRIYFHSFVYSQFVSHAYIPIL